VLQFCIALNQNLPAKNAGGFYKRSHLLLVGFYRIWRARIAYFMKVRSLSLAVVPFRNAAAAEFRAPRQKIDARSWAEMETASRLI
jgi:hypothetical protein